MNVSANYFQKMAAAFFEPQNDDPSPEFADVRFDIAESELSELGIFMILPILINW